MNYYPFHIAKFAVTLHWTPLQFIRFAAAILQCASVCFHTEHRISAFWKVRFKKRSKIEQKDIITPMHCLAFPSALFGAPFHIDNRTVADCGFWLEYASKTPLEVVADLPHRMRLFWLQCQIMRLRSVHIKTPLTPHYWLDMKGVYVISLPTFIYDMVCCALFYVIPTFYVHVYSK